MIDPNSEDEKYYFVRRERKSESINGKNSKRSLKVTGNAKGGWWKATVGDQMIFNQKRHVIGYKKTLKFCMYKSDKRNRNECIKTDWIMHEYRLPRPTFQEWVICGIKNNGLKKMEDIQNVSQDSTATQHGHYNIPKKVLASHQQISQLEQHNLDKELIVSQPISQFDPNDDFEDFVGCLENDLQHQEVYSEENNNALTTSIFQDQTHYNDSVASMNMVWYNQDLQVQELIATQQISQHDQYNIPQELVASQQISQLDQHNLNKELVGSQPISQLDPSDDFEDFVSHLENELQCHGEYNEGNNNAVTMITFED
ncbi:NAC domain-containing protein 83-like [Diospyros lotus]|uniref:NAC domain-containing protein 83-like n=1 Tax=Diospyros lotus TaxID=55363 RepID=UPI0022532A65|nr:NAC domain-containing protein 83-like [Diospyros lotus]